MPSSTTQEPGDQAVRLGIVGFGETVELASAWGEQHDVPGAPERCLEHARAMRTTLDRRAVAVDGGRRRPGHPGSGTRTVERKVAR